MTTQSIRASQIITTYGPGAIVEAPGGNVFFKLTGPDKTAKIMIEAFIAMINQAVQAG